MAPQIPTRNSMGELLCPRCETILGKGPSPFMLHGEYVGHFEAYVCDICHYSALTSHGYERAVAEASKFGLVGPLVEEETIIEVEDKLQLIEVQASTNIPNIRSKGKEEHSIIENKILVLDSVITIPKLSLSKPLEISVKA